MASVFQQIGNFLGFSTSVPTVSAVSPTTASTNTAFSLQSSNNAVTSGAETIYVAAPGNATIDAHASSSPVVIVGNTGTDTLTGGTGSNLIVGGSGTNIMTGNGGANDVFGHAAGATDYITNFNPGAGEKIALAQGLTYSSVHMATANPSTLGLSSGPVPSEVLSFSDFSTVTLFGVTEHPSASWFI